MSDASKEFRLRQAARLEEAKQYMLRSYRELDASLARHRTGKLRSDFIFDAFLAEQPKFTKLWFDLLEWVLIMGALKYLYSKAESAIVLVVLYVSLALFALYVPVAVGRIFQFFRFPFIKSVLLTILLSSGISFVSGWGVLYLLHTVVDEIAKHPE